MKKFSVLGCTHEGKYLREVIILNDRHRSCSLTVVIVRSGSRRSRKWVIICICLLPILNNYMYDGRINTKVTSNDSIAWKNVCSAKDILSAIFKHFEGQSVAYIFDYVDENTIFFWRIRSDGRVLMWEIDGLAEGEMQWRAHFACRCSWSLQSSSFNSSIESMI